MRNRFILLTIPLYFLFLCGNAQEKIPNTFRYPLDGNYRFSGNYGEIRPNHFHAGIDFSTDPVKHLPIYSIEEGYVSRIKIGSGGYGKVLYVTHPGGYVSVYGHQHHFAQKIKDYAYAEQKRQETFEVEIFPKPEELPVKKGEVIGYTGNTGNTTGPHLHFEIRDAKTEIPLNPQLFLDHTDTEFPTVSRLAIYSVKPHGEPLLTRQIDLSSYKGNKNIALKEALLLPGNAGLAFSCFDRESKSGGKNQVYGIKISVDGKLIYSHKMNGISFDHARYVNWYSDISPAVKREKYQRCFRTGNNELPVFSALVNEGIISNMEGGLHHAEVVFYDVKGNETKLSFHFRQILLPPMETRALPFECCKENEIHDAGIDVLFPKNCFFYDLDLDYRNLKKTAPYLFSNVYKIHASGMPVLKGFEIKLAAPEKFSIPADKLCLVQCDDNLRVVNYCGGELKDGKLCATVKNLGLYAVGADTIPPVIRQTGLPAKKGNKLAGANGLYFKVSDNFSGIGNFRLEINGKWVLAEYEHKTSTIFYLFDEETPTGKLSVVLKAWDKKSNLTTFSRDFIR